MKLLKFSASWCAPCKMLSNVMKDMTISIPVEEIDVDVDASLPGKYGVRGVPTLVIVDDTGTEIRRRSGFMTAEKLKEFIGE